MVLTMELLMVLSTVMMTGQMTVAMRVRRWVVSMVHLTENNLALPMVDQTEKGTEMM